MKKMGSVSIRQIQETVVAIQLTELHAGGGVGKWPCHKCSSGWRIYSKGYLRSYVKGVRIRSINSNDNEKGQQKLKVLWETVPLPCHTLSYPGCREQDKTKADCDKIQIALAFQCQK